MRALSLSGFLKIYLRELSSGGTVSIRKLAGQLAKRPQLKEALFLYALCADQVALLAAALPEPSLLAELTWLAERYNGCTIELALQFAAEDLPPGYKKVYASYQSRRDAVVHDNHSKYLMRQRILNLQAAQGISNYRIYRDLGLNQGNVNDFLKNGDCNKLSLPVVRRILDYLETAGA